MFSRLSPRCSRRLALELVLWQSRQRLVYCEFLAARQRRGVYFQRFGQSVRGLSWLLTRTTPTLGVIHL